MAKTTKAKKTKGGKVDGRSKAARAAKAAGTGGNGRALHSADNGGDEAIKAGFHQFRGRWNQIQAKLKAVNKDLRDMVAEAKSAGYQKQEFVIADMLSAGPKKEANVVAAVETRLRVARWMGHALGNQLDMFADAVDRPEPADAAYEAGEQAGLEGAKMEVPGQFSSNDLSQAWLSGWHKGQDALLKKGIKPLEDNVVGPAGGWGASKATV